MSLRNDVKKTWNWIWNSDSFLSWIVALVVVFIFVKFIFFPILSLIMGTSLPLAGVESSSMDHQIVRDDLGILNICGTVLSEEDKRYIYFDEYWEYCGEWYEKKGIFQQDFSEFDLKHGFKKGDIVIVLGRFEPNIGDIIIFKPNPDSIAPRPIVHRIVAISDNKIETKGDHNQDQLVRSNNIFRTDETEISESQVIGKVILKIPYLGWVKIFFVELLSKFR
ncbi:S26 family signal peptidase [Candidatus Pacearchaeota archaeon]|nr:S26 family signal peptidase [Candidatus Pacearchaeota archaeon]